MQSGALPLTLTACAIGNGVFRPLTVPEQAEISLVGTFGALRVGNAYRHRIWSVAVLWMDNSVPGHGFSDSWRKCNNGCPRGCGTIARDRSDATATWSGFAAQWPSGSIVNADGHSFTLYLLPATTGFTYDQAGGDMYRNLCHAAGLRPVIADDSSCTSAISGPPVAVKLPQVQRVGSEGEWSQGWGTTIDVLYWSRRYPCSHRVDFVITRSASCGFPMNYPNYDTGWETPKHSVCAVEN